MKQAVFAAAFIVGVSLTACSNPKAANESNFKIAVQKYLDTQPLCVEIPLDDLPGEASTSDYHKKELDGLTEVGLLSAKTTTVTRKKVFGSALQVPGYRYDLTVEGKKFLSGKKSAYSGYPQLCFGKPTVSKIVRFTEPAERMGVKASQVVFKYKYTEIPTWATDARMKQPFNELRHVSQQEQEGNTLLVLTNEGWMSALLMGN